MSPRLYLAIDVEATCCDRGTIPPGQMEIIELGAVLTDALDFSVVSEFQSYVRPVRHPRLTPFCMQLTSIGQADVDGAPPFRDFVRGFKRWLYQYEDFVFCSWGDYDLKQLRQDCGYHSVPFPISASHVNLKRVFTERHGLLKKPGLAEAVRLAGLPFLGTHHRGIDDARNVARLLPYSFGTTGLREGQ